MVKIKRGLDLPLKGSPDGNLPPENSRKSVKKVALIGGDYVGMKPSMKVRPGDEVKKGQIIFTCKKTEGVHYTAPAAGKVLEVNRGKRRVFESLVIEVASKEEEVTYENYSKKELTSWDNEGVRALLVETGLWTALRTRPYSKVPESNHAHDHSSPTFNTCLSSFKHSKVCLKTSIIKTKE
jgi:Na+-transporting NADH:ubiquinone oxidoreductase subunit A